jgi:hypothetical protein
MTKENYITFTSDGRFEERGFLYAALGMSIRDDGAAVSWDHRAGGRGTFRVINSQLELNYTSDSYTGRGGPIRMNISPFPGAGGPGPLTTILLNTHYTFVRVGAGGRAP